MTQSIIHAEFKICYKIRPRDENPQRNFITLIRIPKLITYLSSKVTALPKLSTEKYSE